MTGSCVTTNATAIRSALAAGDIRRVLAIRASRLGDLLMTTPALHGFAQTWPYCEIDFLTNRYSEDFLGGNTDIHKVHAFDGTERDLLGRKAKAIRSKLAGRYSMILALRPRHLLTRLAEILEIPYLFPDSSAGVGDASQHVIQHGFDRLRPLGIKGEPGPMRLNISEQEESSVVAGLPHNGKPLVLLHPGCDETLRFQLRRNGKSRLWPTACWVELIDKLQKHLGAEVVVSSGNRIESIWVDKIRAACTQAPRHFSGLPGREFCRLIHCVDLVITIDTGPLHVACATGTPLIALYGPSPRRFTGPWGENTLAIQKDLECSPCQGQSIRCTRNICMEQILPSEVLQAAQQLVYKSRKRLPNY